MKLYPYQEEILQWLFNPLDERNNIRYTGKSKYATNIMPNKILGKKAYFIIDEYTD
jgi:hypothetical protein